MADILSDYPPSGVSGDRASNGGQQTPKPIPYSPPQGPKGIMDPQSPGLHGTNHGNCGTQQKG